MLAREGCLLRIFIGDGDRHEGRPLYEWLVLRARELGVAGGRDALTGSSLPPDDGTLWLPPYTVLWLTSP